jgi:hypothetical protein
MIPLSAGFETSVLIRFWGVFAGRPPRALQIQPRAYAADSHRFDNLLGIPDYVSRKELILNEIYMQKFGKK